MLYLKSDVTVRGVVGVHGAHHARPRRALSRWGSRPPPQEIRSSEVILLLCERVCEALRRTVRGEG